ncbi:hypothetical protein PCANC_07988 [Puccinia coronata f. sp. avenae]|uniref:Uncharacterized protein n=1 Tax=Puccinia coronata f. sp. avenae TaxID=200324 RepID=A0A2N5SWA9_9BASI|nr:hypothetical protein PCANC_07988 [Puccinia coronata f. sp. avenae]PLW36971.1 hypothetical protein PCASD_06639 [Puccinia coronata f. sp. avenae]
MDQEFESLAGLIMHALCELDDRRTDQGKATHTSLEKFETTVSREKSSTHPLYAKKRNDSIVRSKLIKNTTPWRLRTKDLPLLHHHVSQLCAVLDLASIGSDTDHRLREAIKILPHVDHCVHQINATIASLWDSPKPEDSEQDTTEWTVQRCHRLISMYKVVLSMLSRLLGEFETFLTHFIPDDPTSATPGDRLISHPVRDVQRFTLTRCIEWLHQSNAGELEKHIQEQTIIREQIQGLVPVVKLSRVLMKKLRNLARSQRRFISRTNLKVLEALQDATQDLPNCLHDISRNLYCPRPHVPMLTQSMSSLARLFDKIKVILNQHVDSLDPATYEPEAARQTCREWSQLWMSQYDLALEKFMIISNDHITDDIMITLAE